MQHSLAWTNAPRSITVISWIFIAFGSIALLTSLLPPVDTDAAQLIVELKAIWIIHVARTLAVLCGVSMLYGFNWARWLLVVRISRHPQCHALVIRAVPTENS